MPEFTLVKERTMKLSKLVGDRFKERPANCQIDSHALMVKGGKFQIIVVKKQSI